MKCLIVIATSSACANELDSIRQALKTHQIETQEIEWVTQADFLTQMGKPDSPKFNLVYLAAHADMYGFGETGGFALHSWDDLANAICISSCMLPGATLFLGCCRGGMKTVALSILKGCDQIDYICGPLWNTKGTKLIQAFNSFAECKFAEDLEPSAIRERMTNAAGQHFSCYDRMELESEVAMLKQIGNIQWHLEQLIASQNSVVAAIEKLNQTFSQMSCDPNDPSAIPFSTAVEAKVP